MPITNSLAFLFTVLGDWWVERKVISRGMSYLLLFSRNCSVKGKGGEANMLVFSVETWLGMALSLAGIALCVQSKR